MRERTGRWPSIEEAYAESAERLSSFAAAQIKGLTPEIQAEITAAVNKAIANPTVVNAVVNTDKLPEIDKTNFLPSSGDITTLFTSIYEKLFKNIMLAPAVFSNSVLFKVIWMI